MRLSSLRARCAPAFASILAFVAASPERAAAQSPPHAPSPHARLAAHIDSLADAPIRRGDAAGMAVFVVRGADTLVARGYGRADLENDVPMTPGHVFQIASITKEFTAAAVLALVQDGRVALDAPVARYLPNAPLQGHVVTVRQLLSHTAGIADYAESPRRAGFARLDLPPDSLVAVVRATPFYFAPGDQMRYSNTGFALLGQLVERVSGRPYAAFVEERVLRPAGAARAHFCDPRALVPRLARGYAATPRGLRPAEFISPHVPFAAGGFCATAGDLAAWNAALHGGRVLRAPAYAEMVRPATVRGGRVARYGLGLSLGRLGGRRAFHHGGDINGFTAYSAYFPDHALNVTVLVNTQGPARPDALVAAITDAVLGAPPRPSPPPAPDRTALTALAGRYGDDVDVAVVPTDAGPALRLARGPLPPVLLRYDGDDGRGPAFTDGRARYTFEVGPARAAAVWADLGVSLVRWARAG